MADKSGITWTNATWNVVTGCTPCSEECRNCWAKQLHDMRHKAYLAGKKMPKQYAKPFEEIQLLPERMMDPLRWRADRMVFPVSTGDLFHGRVPTQFITDAFGVMALAHWHTFQVLTKRIDAARAYLSAGDHGIIAQFRAIQEVGGMGPRQMFRALDIKRRDGITWEWPLPNVWIGTTVGTRKRLPDIDILRDTPAAVRWLSVEPLLEDLGTLNLEGIHWVVAGCESGKGARPCDINWIRSLRDQAKAAGAAFYLKQMMVNGKLVITPELDGRRWTEFPR